MSSDLLDTYILGRSLYYTTHLFLLTPPALPVVPPAPSDQLHHGSYEARRHLSDGRDGHMRRDVRTIREPEATRVTMWSTLAIMHASPGSKMTAVASLPKSRGPPPSRHTIRPQTREATCSVPPHACWRSITISAPCLTTDGLIPGRGESQACTGTRVCHKRYFHYLVRFSWPCTRWATLHSCQT